jgi:hypothetical protein
VIPEFAIASVRRTFSALHSSVDVIQDLELSKKRVLRQRHNQLTEGQIGKPPTADPRTSVHSTASFRHRLGFAGRANWM